jgi:aspartate aminotransferase
VLDLATSCTVAYNAMSEGQHGAAIPKYPGHNREYAGSPHEMPLEGIVTAIRERAIPHHKNWFAYKTSEQDPQAFIAESLGRELDLSFEPGDIALTTGAFAAIMVAFRLVVDAGDEVIYSEPAWFCYEPMLLAANVPRKVKCTAAFRLGV